MYEAVSRRSCFFSRHLLEKISFCCKIHSTEHEQNTRQYLHDVGIRILELSYRSPGLNPIEHVEHNPGRRIQRNYEYNSTERASVQLIWNQVYLLERGRIRRVFSFIVTRISK